MSSTLRTISASLVALSLVVVGCSSPAASLADPKPAAKPKKASVKEVARGQTESKYRARIQILVTGSVSFAQGPIRTTIQVTESGKPLAKTQWSYRAGTASPIKLEDGRLLTLTVDLPMGWNGPGSYELKGDATDDAEVLFQLHRPATDDDFLRFDRFASACDLTVAKDDRSGSVDCSDIRDTEGRAIHLQWNWARL